MVSDSMMFQRGQPTPSDPRLGNFYGLAMPLIKHGLPVAPVQLENVTVPNYLDNFHILFLSYDGQKPLSPEVHAPLADWVKRGGVLIFCDADADPYLKVREWWNRDGNHYATPRQPLFQALGLDDSVATNQFIPVKKGGLIWLRSRPADLSASATGADEVMAMAKLAAEKVGLNWRESNYLLLQRGPYIIAAGLDESISGEPKILRGRFVNLFDSELRVLKEVTLAPGARYFLRDLDATPAPDRQLLAAACKALPEKSPGQTLAFTVESVAGTPAVMLFRTAQPPRSITLDGLPVTDFNFSKPDGLLWVRFENTASPRNLTLNF